MVSAEAFRIFSKLGYQDINSIHASKFKIVNDNNMFFQEGTYISENYYKKLLSGYFPCSRLKLNFRDLIQSTFPASDVLASLSLTLNMFHTLR